MDQNNYGCGMKYLSLFQQQADISNNDTLQELTQHICYHHADDHITFNVYLCRIFLHLTTCCVIIEVVVVKMNILYFVFSKG